MCLLLLQYRTVAAAPVLLAANREEFFGRAATVPERHDGNSLHMVTSEDEAKPLNRSKVKGAYADGARAARHCTHIPVSSTTDLYVYC